MAFLPDFFLISPEIILILSAFILLMKGTFSKQGQEERHFYNFTTIVVLGVALIVLFLLPVRGERLVSFSGQFILDDFIIYVKAIILLATAAVVIMATAGTEREYTQKDEFAVLVLFVTSGMMLALSANDLIILFLGIELQALPFYILIAMARAQKLSSEASLKYFILGALSSCFYLYGASFLYGFSGSTNFDILQAIFRLNTVSAIPFSGCIGLLLIISSLAFKTSLVPFHMWAPDVYEGSPYGITNFLASASKFTALMIFLKLLFQPFEFLGEIWRDLLFYVVAASLLCGALAALWQENIKRLLAYSAIHHMGYSMMGVVAGTEEGAQAALLYATFYLILIIGTFSCLMSLKDRAGKQIQTLTSLTGLGYTCPFVAFALVIFLFSMAGIPPFVGLFIKFYAIKAALAEGLYPLVIVAAISSVIAAYYYLIIIKKMFFEAPLEPYGLGPEYVAYKSEIFIVLTICLISTLVFLLWPSIFISKIHQAIFVLMS